MSGNKPAHTSKHEDLVSMASSLLRRCLAALAEWELLSVQCRADWRRAEPHVKREMAPMAAHAAWHMGQWGEMDVYVHTMNRDSTPDDSAGAFLTAVLNVHGGSHAGAKCEARSFRVLAAA